MKINSYNQFIIESDIDDDFSTPEKFHKHLSRLKSDTDYKEQWLKIKDTELRQWWSELKPFKDDDDVPSLPNPLDDFYIQRLIELGAIPKSELKDGQWYYGNFRNSSFGKWDADKFVFHHLRYSFGWYWDECNHFEDDDRFALFAPLREATQDEIKNELSKVEKSS
jgi:hypothetical protein